MGLSQQELRHYLATGESNNSVLHKKCNILPSCRHRDLGIYVVFRRYVLKYAVFLFLNLNCDFPVVENCRSLCMPTHVCVLVWGGAQWRRSALTVTHPEPAHPSREETTKVTFLGRLGLLLSALLTSPWALLNWIIQTLGNAFVVSLDYLASQKKESGT